MKKILMLVSALALVAPCALAQRNNLAGWPEAEVPQPPHDFVLENDNNRPNLEAVLQRTVEQAQQRAQAAAAEVEIPRELVLYRNYIENAKEFDHQTRGMIIQFGENVDVAMKANEAAYNEYVAYLNPVEKVINGKTVRGIVPGWDKNIVFNWPDDLIAAENQYKDESFTYVSPSKLRAPVVKSEGAKAILHAIEFLRKCAPEHVEQASVSVDDMFADYGSKLSASEEKALVEYYQNVYDLRTSKSVNHNDAKIQK